MVFAEGFLTRAEERIIIAETVWVGCNRFMTVIHIVDGVASLYVDFSGVRVDDVNFLSVFVVCWDVFIPFA